MGWFAICSGALVVGIFIGMFIGVFVVAEILDRAGMISGDEDNEHMDFAAEDVEVVAGDVSRKDIWN